MRLVSVRALPLMLLIAGLQVGCDPKIEHPELYEHCGNRANFKDFVSNSKFPYAIPSKDTESIVMNFPKLSLKSNQEEAAALLGEPTFRELVHAGTGNPPPIFGCIWVWELEKATPKKEASVGDRSIEIWFDPDGNMGWAAPRNIPTLKRIEKDK